MTLDRVITEIYWGGGQGFDPRAESVISNADKIRIDAADRKVKLKADATTGRYPLDADLSVRSRIFRPKAVQTLLMLQVDKEIPLDDAGVALGTVKLRLFDGVVERYWDGAAWVPAGVGNWNSEAEVNANLPAFDVSARSFAVVFNLQTVDSRQTPVVSAARVLWEGSIDWTQDLLIDSFTAEVKEAAAYAEDATLPALPNSTSVIDLDDYVDEAQLDVADVEAVYDHTVDGAHRVNLLTSYDPVTRVVQLSAQIPSGHVPYLRLRVRATVIWDSSRDFCEVKRLPQVVLSDVSAKYSSVLPLWGRREIVREDTGDAVVVPPPYRVTYVIEVEVTTTRSRAQQRLAEVLMALFAAGPASEAGPFLRARAVDERYRLWLRDEYDARPLLAADNSDIRRFGMQVRIENAAVAIRPAYDARAVSQLKLKTRYISSDADVTAAAQGALPVRSPESEHVIS